MKRELAQPNKYVPYGVYLIQLYEQFNDPVILNKTCLFKMFFIAVSQELKCPRNFLGLVFNEQKFHIGPEIVNWENNRAKQV